jgi:hypothetical protein
MVGWNLMLGYGFTASVVARAWGKSMYGRKEAKTGDVEY